MSTNGIWTESQHNYWVDASNKYGLKLQASGNYSLKITDLHNGGKIIVSVYLGIRKEDEARAYMYNLLFINQDADALVARLKRADKEWRDGRAGHRR